jgi:hypothetical protein
MKNNMKNLRTNCCQIIVNWFFLTFLIQSISINFVTSENQSPESVNPVNEFQQKQVDRVQVTSVREVKIDKNVTIAYQPDYKLFLINGSGFGKPVEKLALKPVKSNESCKKSHQLSVISLENHQLNENQLILKIHTKQLENSKGIYLCVFDENSFEHGKHLGESSLFIMIE